MKRINIDNLDVTDINYTELHNINGGGVYELFRGIGSACGSAWRSVVDAFRSMPSHDDTEYGGIYLESISGRSSIM